MKRKEKPVDWYDEKQLMDLSRGALITLVISVLLMSVVFVLTALNIMQISTLKVFSLYLCGTLLVFSLSNQLIAD